MKSNRQKLKTLARWFLKKPFDSLTFYSELRKMNGSWYAKGWFLQRRRHKKLSKKIEERHQT